MFDKEAEIVFKNVQHKANIFYSSNAATPYHDFIGTV